MTASKHSKAWKWAPKCLNTDPFIRSSNACSSVPHTTSDSAFSTTWKYHFKTHMHTKANTNQAEQYVPLGFYHRRKNCCWTLGTYSRDTSSRWRATTAGFPDQRSACNVWSRTSPLADSCQLFSACARVHRYKNWKILHQTRVR